MMAREFLCYEREQLFDVMEWTTVDYMRRTVFKKDTAQKMKFSIKDLFTKCDQIRCFLWFVHIYWGNP